MEKKIAILGSTGSIGTQTLEVAEKLGLTVTALAAYSDIKRLEEQIRRWKPAVAAVFQQKAADDLKIAVADTETRVVSGMEGLMEAACEKNAQVTLNAVVGMVGLQPTLAAISAGKDIALANKETLVAGGALVMDAAQRMGVKILPVDSEHSAIFQCLQGCDNQKEVKRILLTASGGPFFGKTREQLQNVKAKDALKHPNWDMGAKVTIDSSTMMNKGLEVLEASWLFDLPDEKIHVIVHRESILHSAVEFCDHAVIAQLGVPDMKIPIQYALTWPQRMESLSGELDLISCGKLTFYEPDTKAFPCLAACRKALRRGGLVPAAVNGANEAAVKLFLEDKISFNSIGDMVSAAAEVFEVGEVTLDGILQTDRAAREFILKHV